MKKIQITIPSSTECFDNNSELQRHQDIIYQLDALFRAFSQVYRKDSLDNKASNDQYGYYSNTNLYGLYSFIKANPHIQNVLDLGCGAALFIRTIQLSILTNVGGRTLKIFGYDIDENLISIANKFCNNSSNVNFKVKDIITLTKEDIEHAQLLYFWEPIRGKKTKDFVDNLYKIMNKNQVIFYKPAGNILDHFENLEKEGKIKMNYFYGAKIIIKIK